jgi:hypothetical protein
MSANRTKLIVVGCLSLGILVCLILGVSGYLYIKALPAPQGNDGQAPRRSVNITINTSYRYLFFDQMRKFAAKDGFTIRIDTSPKGPDWFWIWMNRGDVNISCINPWVPGEYELGIYDNDSQHPAADLIYDILVNDVKSFIGVVPGATITVVK